jgi:GT2 family glycosyltransferase
MDKNVSIIIPVFNGLKFTKKCLAKLAKDILLAKGMGFIYDVVIVDDGSTDGSAEWIRENHPDVNIVSGDGSLWWSGGINRGVNYAIDKLKADYILWWNNDILQDDVYFRNMSQLLRQCNAKVVYGSKIYYAEVPDRIWSYGGEFYPVKGNYHMLGTYHKDSSEFSKEREVDWFAGMGTIFPVEVYEKVGFLDEVNFPQYHGDSDYTYRCKLAGYKLMISPELRIWNITENTGNEHDNSLKMLVYTLNDIKSGYNLKKDLIFYKKYARSIRAYRILFVKYGHYIGGFLKWKMLSAIGFKRPVKEVRYMSN